MRIASISPVDEWAAAAPNDRPVQVTVEGKQFSLRSRRFKFKGVTYGTFQDRGDGALFPDRSRLKFDLIDIADAGFTVVRTYTPPPDDLLEIAADCNLRLMSEVFYLDWRYLIGMSRRQLSRISAEARREVKAQARRLAGNDSILALSLGNEVPADVVRWVGTERIAGVINDLAAVVHEEDPHRLVTYANYPTTEYLPLEGLDFLTFNVFLEDPEQFRRYVTHLQHLAGNLPLVLGEFGLDAGNGSAGEHRQAEVVDAQLQIAAEHGVAGCCLFSWTDEWCVGGNAVEDWHFGLTRADRSPRPALEVAKDWNHRSLRDLRESWPSMSVVICAHNGAETLHECLRHTSALDYPDLEVLVVDDGSTDTTARIARQFPRVSLIEIPHSGLSTARNEGLRCARGEIVAYLDADAFPSPEWPYYLALGFNGPRVGGVGGPNVPPGDEPVGAQVVARSPGGPVQVLFSDDRAEHIPGCNMAFWKRVLTEVGGFDPVYTSAGDDVDLCWRVLDQGWEIGFSSAALVWHRRRGGLGAYLRQQRGYGRAEALVEARHPERFGPLRTASWRGRIYNTLVPVSQRQRIYRGPLGLSPFQSVYRSESHLMDVMLQVGVLGAGVSLLCAPLALLSPALALIPVLALAYLAVLGVVDMARVKPPNGFGMRFRAAVAVHHLLQPFVRTWGRCTNSDPSARDLPSNPLPGPPRRVGRTVIFPSHRCRSEVVSGIVSLLRRTGFRVRMASEWEDCDARIALSRLVDGALVTSGHVPNVVQMRIRPRLLLTRLAIVVVLATGLFLASFEVGTMLIFLAGTDIAWGCWRSGPRIIRMLDPSAGDRR